MATVAQPHEQTLPTYETRTSRLGVAATGTWRYLRRNPELIVGLCLLIALMALATVLYVFQGGLDLVRSRISARVGRHLDETLGLRVFDAMVRLPLKTRGDGDGLQPLRDLDQELDSMWRELQDPKSALRREAEGQGLDLQKVSGLSRKGAITVTQEGEGFDPVTTAIIVAFAPVAAEMVRDLWRNVLLPRLRKHKGQDALGDEKKA